MYKRQAFIENKNETLTPSDIDLLFSGLPKNGFMNANYSNVFFHPIECQELDQYRSNVEKLSSKFKRSLALILLRRAMIRKMPYSRFTIDWVTIKKLRDEDYSYRKYGRRRAYHNESFKDHILYDVDSYNNAVFDNGQVNSTYNDDIFNLLGSVEADAIYLDPPYSGTMNNYFGFYGVLDEYVESKKLVPFANNFVSKNQALYLFEMLFSKLNNYKYWFLSYNNLSYPSKDSLVFLLQQFAPSVEVVEKKHVYKVTGKNNKKSNSEYVFIVNNSKRRRARDGTSNKKVFSQKALLSAV